MVAPFRNSAGALQGGGTLLPSAALGERAQGFVGGVTGLEVLQGGIALLPGPVLGGQVQGLVG